MKPKPCDFVSCKLPLSTGDLVFEFVVSGIHVFMSYMS